MATSYPGGLDAFTNPTATDSLGSTTVPHATQHANANDAIEAIQAELGTDPAGASATVKARFEAIEANDWVTSARIAANAVGSSELADNAVDTAAIADSAVTSGKIADSAVTSAKIADGAIVDADINASAAIAQSKIANLTSDLAGKAPTASPTFTGVQSNPGGSAGAPSITFTGDTNTGLYSPGADTLAVSTGGTERMRIDSSGNVGIGTSSPTSRLQVEGLTGSAALVAISNLNGGLPTATDGLAVGQNLASGQAEVDYIHNSASFRNLSGGHRFVQRTGASSSADLMWIQEDLARFYTANTERMRIDNAGLITGTGTSLGAWTAYTPTWVGFTAGNGTGNFAYTRVGKTVHVRGAFALGSTSAMTGPLDISLPVAIGSGYNNVHPLGVAFYYDISAGVSGPLAPILVNSGARLLSIKTDGAYATQDETTATTPITWATGDYFYIHLTYETSA